MVCDCLVPCVPETRQDKGIIPLFFCLNVDGDFLWTNEIDEFWTNSERFVGNPAGLSVEIVGARDGPFSG